MMCLCLCVSVFCVYVGCVFVRMCFCCLCLVCVCMVCVDVYVWCVSHIFTNNSVTFICRTDFIKKLVHGILSPRNLIIQMRSTVT